ncbi:kynureninase/PvdN C-terminal domain-containing protein, partial [Nocardia gipuzkoensis]
RAKSVALSEEFIALAGDRLARYGVDVTGPTDSAQRGSHVSLRSESAERLAEGLAARGFHLELRPPDLLRFGLAPLHIRHVDVFDCVAGMEQLLDEESAGTVHGGRRQ